MRYIGVALKVETFVHFSLRVSFAGHGPQSGETPLITQFERGFESMQKQK
jgi:hypothetical protein